VGSMGDRWKTGRPLKGEAFGSRSERNWRRRTERKKGGAAEKKGGGKSERKKISRILGLGGGDYKRF